MAGEIVPYLEPGCHPTGRPTADLSGGCAVMVDSAATPQFSAALRTTAGDGAIPVKVCTAATRMFGVAHKDVTAASKELVTIYREGIVPAIAGAAITAGVEVEVGSGGRFITLASGRAVGYAVNGAGANGNTFALAIYS